MNNKLVTITLCFCISVSLWAQDTSATVLSVVPVEASFAAQTISTDVSHGSPRYVIGLKNLQYLGVTDIGSALQFMPGIQLKDYGGIGGLKTISYRSLGSTHSVLSIDNNLLLNTQTGALDLSFFEVFGISQLSFTAGQPKSPLLMASAYLPANSIAIKSLLAAPSQLLKVSLYQNVTTINSFESGLLFKVPIARKGFIGAKFMGRYGSGQYPYSYALTGATEKFTRENSSMLGLKSRISAGYRSKNINVTGSFIFEDSDQQLPGAVILYNPSNDQELQKRNYRGDVDATLKKNDWLIRTNAFYQNNTTHYYDPNFLNVQGFIESNYEQAITGAGVLANRYLGAKRQRLFVGSDMNYASLISNEYSQRPTRLNSNSVIGTAMDFGRLKLESNVSFQFINDYTVAADTNSQRQFQKLSPYLSLAFIPFKNIGLRIRSFYKHAFRMPSFNDLYYNFVGNVGLRPEEAQLINFGITYAKGSKSQRVELNVDGFYNDIKDKIVAIPTKDIFNWSMQNIGRSRSLGVDLAISYSEIRNDWTWALSSNHNFNRSTDITNPSIPSFGHQLPYTPTYTNSSLVSVGWKGYTLTSNLLYNGVRYALNENIPVNRLDPFFDWNLGIEKEFEMGPSVIWASVKAMNLLNTNYEVVRSFPMPGRYYQFTLKFNYQ